MSRIFATAFQTLNKSLARDTRSKTLDLYKRLLRSTEKYEQNANMKQAIREKFQANKHNTSRTQVLSLLKEADKTVEYLEKGSSGHETIAKKINEYTKKYLTPKQTPIIMNETIDKKKKKKTKFTKRKPYQVAITTTTANGFTFKRVRGWRQPVRTSMMLKNRVKTLQARLDRFNEFKSQLDMIKSERLFLENLGCLPKDRLISFEQTIKLGMDANNKTSPNKNKKP